MKSSPFQYVIYDMAWQYDMVWHRNMRYGNLVRDAMVCSISVAILHTYLQAFPVLVHLSLL